MKYRIIELYHEQALDNVGTKIIDLRTVSPLSAIRLSIWGTNYSDSNKSNYPHDVFTKIELVDGSDQLISMSAKEAQAIQVHKTGKMPYMRGGEAASGSQEESVTILFGRYLWDPEYYMDLTKFLNPQLKITTNIAAIRALGSLGFATGTLKVTIDLFTMEEGATAAKGFFMQKNIYGFTAGTAGDEHIDMPMDYPYAGLLLRAELAGKDVDENISKIKLNCDAGKFIPIEKHVKELYTAEEERIAPLTLRQYVFRKHGETFNHPLNHDPYITLTPSVAGRIAGASWSWSSQFYLLLTDHAGTAITAEEALLLEVTGSCLHSTIYVPFGIKEDPATYFVPKDFNDIDLVLTQAAAADVSIVLDQLRPYGAAA